MKTKNEEPVNLIADVVKKLKEMEKKVYEAKTVKVSSEFRDNAAKDILCALVSTDTPDWSYGSKAEVIKEAIEYTDLLIKALRRD